MEKETNFWNILVFQHVHLHCKAFDVNLFTYYLPYNFHNKFLTLVHSTYVYVSNKMILFYFILCEIAFIT